jgi:hypothetical protein
MLPKVIEVKEMVEAPSVGIILKYCLAKAPVISLQVILPATAVEAVERFKLVEVPTVVHAILSELV